jgi:hypothetical protein
MGLDMYAYAAARAGQSKEYWDSASLDPDTKEYVSAVCRPREIAYWRKHPNLHGWMHRLWNQKGYTGHFNGDELELTREDLDQLEHAVVEGTLPGTSGFFFGNDADDYYREDDLAFIRNARAELFLGLRVFYNSSW